MLNLTNVAIDGYTYSKVVGLENKCLNPTQISKLFLKAKKHKKLEKYDFCQQESYNA
jgi:hypothetical protein